MLCSLFILISYFLSFNFFLVFFSHFSVLFICLTFSFHVPLFIIFFFPVKAPFIFLSSLCVSFCLISYFPIPLSFSLLHFQSTLLVSIVSSHSLRLSFLSLPPDLLPSILLFFRFIPLFPFHSLFQFILLTKMS